MFVLTNMKTPFYVTREKGNWFAVTPFRKVFCFNLEEACEFITYKK